MNRLQLGSFNLSSKRLCLGTKKASGCTGWFIVYKGMSMFRQVYLQVDLCVGRSICRQVYVQVGLCVGRSICRQVYLQVGLCVGGSMCRQAYVQAGLCVGRSMCRYVYVWVYVQVDLSYASQSTGGQVIGRFSWKWAMAVNVKGRPWF